jgi:hypothetical protein
VVEAKAQLVKQEVLVVVEVVAAIPQVELELLVKALVVAKVPKVEYQVVAAAVALAASELEQAIAVVGQVVMA